uniref:Uncharacterized protein n=1 Tax=Vitrella brassicaformis TaxID=1169539 RepID=A0A7S1JMM6_9ALVE|mmetsp:Transcript_14475/g.34541  ORF Transcript_14475/g.34541 Transcript_14475/m.34541 type:complete len:589 (+) Transcript_14475:181-1947(+)
MANSSCPLPECDSPDPHPIHPMSKGPEPSSTKHVRFQEEVIRESYEVLSPRYQWGSCYSSMDDDSDDIDSLFPRAPSADELKKQYGQAVRHILDLGSTSTLSTTRHFIEGAEAPSPALSLSSRSSFGLSEKGSCSDDEEMRTPNPQERKRVVRNRLRRRRSLMSRTSSLQHSTSKDSGLPTLRNPPPLTLPVLSALRSKKSAGSSDLSSPSEMGHGLGGRDGDDEGSPSSATASATVSILSPPMRADDRVGDHRQGTSTQSTNRHSDLGATLRRHVSFEDRRLHTDEDDNDNDDFFSSERRERRSELIRSRKRTGVTRLTADQLEELQAAFAPTEDDLTASDEHHDPYPYMRHRPPGLSPPGGRDRDRDRRVGKNGKNVSFGPSQQAGEDGEPDADFYHPDRRDLRARMIRGRKKTGVTPLSPEQRAELRDLMCCDADMSTPMAESTSTSAAAAAAAELRPPECDGGIPRKVSFTEGSPSVLGPDDTSAFDDPDRRRRRQELCRRRKKTGYVRLSESELAELRNEFYHYYSEEEQQRQRQLQGAASARGDMMSAAAAAAAAAGHWQHWSRPLCRLAAAHSLSPWPSPV